MATTQTTKPALICPPHNVAPVDAAPDVLFGKVWWLFFHNLAKTVVSLVTLGNDLAATVQKLVDAGSGGGKGTGVVLVDITLHADSTAIPVTAAAGTIVLVIIREDGTGGWKQTWPAAFVGMLGYVDLQTTTLNTYTSALFYTADGTTFQLISAPVTGVQ